MAHHVREDTAKAAIVNLLNEFFQFQHAVLQGIFRSTISFILVAINLAYYWKVYCYVGRPVGRLIVALLPFDIERSETSYQGTGGFFGFGLWVIIFFKILGLAEDSFPQSAAMDDEYWNNLVWNQVDALGAFALALLVLTLFSGVVKLLVRLLPRT